MGYIKFNADMLQKLPQETLETLIDDKVIVVDENGLAEIDEDLIGLVAMIANENSEETFEESELSDKMKSDIKSLAEKYSSKNGYKDDIVLRKTMYLESRDSNVYAFYVYQNWIYLLDDEGSDIDPNDVEESFLEKFTDYIADERNIQK